MKRILTNSSILLVAIIAVALLPRPALAGGRDGGDSTKKPDPSGSYTATVAGCFKGKGQATATANTISISAPDVTDENGNPGSFSATSLTVDNKNHVTGTGTAFGMNLKLSGRLDPATANDKTLKTHRFVC